MKQLDADSSDVMAFLVSGGISGPAIADKKEGSYTQRVFSAGDEYK